MGIIQSHCNETTASGSNDVGIGMRDELGFKATRYEQQQQQQYCQPTLSMGSLGGLHTRSGSVRSTPRQPMPDGVELERRFTKVLVSLRHIYNSNCLYQFILLFSYEVLFVIYK